MGCVACQPILNINRQVFSYELLYRSSTQSAGFDNKDGNAATMELLDTAFNDIGIRKITEGRRSFVNFTYDLLVQGIPMLYSKDMLVVEILEDVEPTAEIIEACKKLKKNGYILALDDFATMPEYNELMELADIIKIDFLLVKEKEELRNLVKEIREKLGDKILLAEKVETYEEFEMAKQLGFVLFQGYFFSRPKVLEGQHHLSPLGLSRLQLVGLVQKKELNFQHIADVIKRDVVLSHKLLRIVNSAYYGLSIPVTGILHALTILGAEETKRWISYGVLQDSKGDTEQVLSRMALQRALFMEKLAIKNRRKKEKELYFLFGLFSLADVLMQAPMEEILERTNLAPVVSRQLIAGYGEYVEMLSMLTHYERGEWDEVSKVARNYSMTVEMVGEMYVETLSKASELI